MGSVYRRGRIWWIKYHRDGRPFRESSRSTKESAARSLLRLREGDIEHGLPVTPRIGRLRFDEAVADVVQDYQVNGKRWLGHVERRIRLHLAPFFGGRRMAAITTTDVRAFIVARQADGASNGEINREISIVKRAFTLAMQAGKLVSRPYIPKLQEDNVRMGFFEREQFDSVRAHLPRPLRAVITFAYVTGWRIQSEVLSLRWRQIDLKAGTVRLDPGSTKNREGRVFPFTRELRTLLEAQREATDAVARETGSIVPWVFHRNGRPIREFRDAWVKSCTRAGCPGRILHDLRRTAVRNLVRAGVPERVAMQLTGHKTRSVFERYNIVSEADLADAVRRLDEQEKPAVTRRG